MAKHASYTHIMSKKMRRTILRSPLQFVTMTLILALASTLFSGLYASHLAFKDQVNRIYEDGNIADVTTTLDYSDKFSEEDPNRDYQLVKNTIGAAGDVEMHYHSSAKIHGLDANVTISDTLPTINKPSEIINDKSTAPDNYLYFCNQYLNIEMNYGKRETWIKDGVYQEMEIQLDNTSINNEIKQLNLTSVFNEFVKDDGNNVLASEYITMKVVPTGSMQHPENIASNSTQPFTFLTTRKFLADRLEESIKQNYDLDALTIKANQVGANQEAYKKCLELLNKKEIMDANWSNNRCVTRLKNRNEAETYRNKIDKAFQDRKDGGQYNILFNVQLNDSVTSQQLNTDMMQSIQMCYVFPPLFLLVGILIVLTTISQIILKERKEIGTLKAIGASNNSILTYYMGLTGIVSLIGIAIGLVVGPLLLPNILNLKYAMLYSLPSIHFVFPTVFAIIMTIAILIITMLVAFLITRKEAKALPVTSMRPKPVTIKNKNLSNNDKKESTHKLCFKMAKRNIFCSIPRSIMVVIGVLGCTALLCCGFGIDDSVQKGINSDTQMFFNTDSMIYFSNQTVETFTTIQNMEIDGKKAVNEFELFGCLPVTSNKVGVLDETFSTNVYSIPRSDTFFDFGGYKPRENKVAVSNKIAKSLNVNVGDSINYTFLGKKYTGKIDRVIDVFYMHGIYVDGDATSSPQWRTFPTCAYTRFNKDLDENKIVENIRSVQGVSSVLDHEAIMNRVTEISSSINYITITIKVFAILLAIVAIYNLALLNFKENIRNIATMKVLGFNRREVAESLFFEIITLSAVGTLLGLTLGWPLTRLTLGINQVPMCEFFYYVSAVSFVLSLVITLGVAAIINSFVGMRNKKVKMVESLKSIE